MKTSTHNKPNLKEVDSLLGDFPTDSENELVKKQDAGTEDVLNDIAASTASRPLQSVPGQCEEVQPPLHLRPLVQRKKPNYVRQQELPKHRMVIELHGQGFKYDEIAARLGMSKVSVQEIVLQPHLQEQLLDTIHKNFGADQEVVDVIKESVVDAVKYLSQVVRGEDDDAKPKDRIAAANALLDRRYGKPNQPINRGTEVDLNTLSDAELAQIATGKN